MTGSEKTIDNALGCLVKHCVAGGCHIGLATATWGRGDMRHILSERAPEAVHPSRIPYDVYFEEVQPVEAFEFHVVAGDVLESLGPIFATRRPTILYLAKRNSYYAGRCKYMEVKQIIRRLAKLFEQACRDGVLTRIGDFKILIS